jgi:hypothetical protein
MVDPERSVSRLRRWADHLVTLLDDRFRIPGTDVRFGLDPIIGILFPGAGDAVTGAGSIGLLALALRRGVPASVLRKMVLNILIDTVFGSLPVVGDIFDVAFKANRRNLELLRAHEGYEPKPTFGSYVIAALGVSLAILSIIVPLVAGAYFAYRFGPAFLERLQLR